jgi:hypothetical protein
MSQMLFHSRDFHENKIMFNSYSRGMNTCDLSVPCMLVLLLELERPFLLRLGNLLMSFTNYKQKDFL